MECYFWLIWLEYIERLLGELVECVGKDVECGI